MTENYSHRDKNNKNKRIVAYDTHILNLQASYSSACHFYICIYKKCDSLPLSTYKNIIAGTSDDHYILVHKKNFHEDTTLIFPTYSFPEHYL